MSLKLLIDAKHNKVVFAEAGKDFVDFLLNLLALPVSTVIRLLTKPTMVGCIANLYESLENLNESFLQPGQNKDSLLKPTVLSQVTNLPLLLPDANQVLPEMRKLYYCRNHPGYVTDIQNSNCHHCGGSYYYMDQEVQFVVKNNAPAATKDNPTSSEGGYVKGLVTYMVTDDLTLSPMSMVSAVRLLNVFNISNFGVLEEKVVGFGIDEGVELLKASLLSKDALTSVFLPKEKVRGDVPSSGN